MQELFQSWKTARTFSCQSIQNDVQDFNNLDREVAKKFLSLQSILSEHVKTTKNLAGAKFWDL